MNRPLVSVIVATYRRDMSLERALNSLVTQTFHDFEIVIVDDNDDIQWNKKTSAVINSFKSKNEGLSVQIIANHHNLGSAEARNIGIEASKGKYITFLDDDDVYLPEKIEYQYRAMVETGADYSLTDLGLYYCNEALCELRKRWYLTSEEGTNLLLCHLKYHMTGTDTMMFRRDYLFSIGEFDPIDVGDEYYLMMKAIEANGRFVYVPRSDVKAYVHTGEGGLSSGSVKIEGENNLYQYKKSFFKRLKYNNIRYIRMRHYAVLAFAYLRMNKYINFFLYAMVSFLVAPRECAKLIINRKG